MRLQAKVRRWHSGIYENTDVATLNRSNQRNDFLLGNGSGYEGHH